MTDENSDLDLMIIVPSTDAKISPPQRTIPGYRALYGLGVAKELIILTEDEFNERSSNENYLAYYARYPDDWFKIDTEEAHQANTTALAIIKFVKQRLPKE